MAAHSSTLAWKIPWMEEPGRPQSMGSLRVGHNWATSLSLFTFMHWRRKWQPTLVFLPGESQGQGSLGAAVYGVAQSQTWLKRLSSSSSSRAIYESSCVVLHHRIHFSLYIMHFLMHSSFLSGFQQFDFSVDFTVSILPSNHLVCCTCKFLSSNLGNY